jgi:hypothetical protein
MGKRRLTSSPLRCNAEEFGLRNGGENRASEVPGWRKRLGSQSVVTECKTYGAPALHLNDHSGERGRSKLPSGLRKSGLGELRSRIGPSGVSAGAKIPIVSFENSPPPWASGVTPPLGTRGGRTPVQGERRGRDQRAQTRRVEHSGNQSADRFRW